MADVSPWGSRHSWFKGPESQVSPEITQALVYTMLLIPLGQLLKKLEQMDSLQRQKSTVDVTANDSIAHARVMIEELLNIIQKNVQPSNSVLPPVRSQDSPERLFSQRPASAMSDISKDSSVQHEQPSHRK